MSNMAKQTFDVTTLKKYFLQVAGAEQGETLYELLKNSGEESMVKALLYTTVFNNYSTDDKEKTSSLLRIADKLYEDLVSINDNVGLFILPGYSTYYAVGKNDRGALEWKKFPRCENTARTLYVKAKIPNGANPECGDCYDLAWPNSKRTAKNYNSITLLGTNIPVQVEDKDYHDEYFRWSPIFVNSSIISDKDRITYRQVLPNILLEGIITCPGDFFNIALDMEKAKTLIDKKGYRFTDKAKRLAAEEFLVNTRAILSYNDQKIKQEQNEIYRHQNNINKAKNDQYDAIHDILLDSVSHGYTTENPGPVKTLLMK